MDDAEQAQWRELEDYLRHVDGDLVAALCHHGPSPLSSDLARWARFPDHARFEMNRRIERLLDEWPATGLEAAVAAVVNALGEGSFGDGRRGWLALLLGQDQDDPRLRLIDRVSTDHGEWHPEHVARFRRRAGQLVALELEECTITGGLDTLFDGVQFEQLRVLSLQECDEKPGSNARTLRAIASSPWLAGVEKLTLTWLEYVDDEAMAALFASPHLVRVQELHLGALSIGAASARAIQAGALPRSLERLCLDSCALDVEALMSLGSLSTLKELELAECRLPAITKAQASSLGAGMTLRELSLSLAIGIGDEKRITGCVVNRLAAMPALATVERLRLSQYDLDAAAVKSLARLQHRAGLRELNVSSCAITDEDRAALHAAFPGCMIR